MIDDRFLALQSLQRASRIELIQKTECFSLYIQGWTTQIPLTSTHHCSISQQHISHVFPHVSSQALFERSCLTRSRSTIISEREFFRSRSPQTLLLRSASLIAKTSESISEQCCELSNLTSAADQLWVVCLYLVLFFFHVMIFK